jgi:uncharacterized protein
MPETNFNLVSPVAYQRVTIKGGFWGERQEVNRTSTIPAIHSQLEKIGHIDAWKLGWKTGMPKQPHVFWDSDLAKWMEAASYSLAQHPDSQLEAQLDEIISSMRDIQMADGYLNSHFINVEPQNRWKNLRDNHELYCAGHLIEAAVAHFQATGKRNFLEVIQRYADHIDSVFGAKEGQLRGYCGHPEIELALVKLGEATADERYLRLSQFFVDERGREPYYFDREAAARGEDPKAFWAKTYEYCQAHKPLRDQHLPVGHAVRATYLYSGMADLGRLTGDEALLAACRRLFANVAEKRMYITGGLGSSAGNEGFTYDYDLPLESAYAETCAAIGLIFWAQRMTRNECAGYYADVLERSLYNGALSGVALDGSHFEYVNPLALHREGEYLNSSRPWGIYSAHRLPWYACACCPPNLARLIASLGGYIYSESESAASVHLFVESETSLNVAGQVVHISQDTTYPWDGGVLFTIEPEREAIFDLNLRLPGWCNQVELCVNGESFPLVSERGYLILRRKWQKGDRVEYHMEMPVKRNYAHPRVRDCRGMTALSRGPLIYCLEGVDNGNMLNSVGLPRKAVFTTHFEPHLLGGIVTIEAEGYRMQEKGWDSRLYRKSRADMLPARLRAVPYYTWDNREEGDLAIWITEEDSPNSDMNNSSARSGEI